MEDYIYILAGVAYLAYSVYSANQKQKKKQQQTAQQPHTETAEQVPIVKKEPTPSIFNEIIGLQNFDINVEEELYGEVENKDVLDVVPEEEGVRTTKIQTKQNEKEELAAQIHYYEEKVEEALDYEFNLRDAVISSEILNPPYINR